MQLLLSYKQRSMELCLNAAILNTIYSQLKDQIGTLDLHMQLKVEVVKLDTFRSGESCEEGLVDSTKVGLERTDIDQRLVHRVRSFFCFARHEIVLDDKRLTRSEVSGIVKGHWLFC